MPERYCPFCGEPVPSNSVTCPKCYREIPEEPFARTQQGRTGSAERSRDEGTERRHRRSERREPRPERPPRERKQRQYSSQTAFALAVIPGFLGLLGLGQIYRDYRSMKGWFVLLLGLVLFTTGMMLLMHWTPSVLVNLFSSLSAFPVFLLYALLYIFAAGDILVGKLFRR